jgi:predicted nucleotidyltransferase
VKQLVSDRVRVAREAATLLYSGQETEYKQAKVRAAENLGFDVLPGNREVAEELDKVADEVEGADRRERLVQMRREALSVMVVLGDFHPRLIGSVWRGTARKDSDIDVEVFASDPEVVVQRLRDDGFHVWKAEWQSVTKGEGSESEFHVFMLLASGCEVEVVVRSPDKLDQVDVCEVYGDVIKGLDMHQLRRVLMMDPVQKFVPE